MRLFYPLLPDVTLYFAISVRLLQRQFGIKKPAVVQQRRGTGPVGAALDLAYKNDVVAFGVLAAIKAFKGSGCAGQQGGATGTFCKIDACPALFSPRCKPFGQRFLLS